MWHDRSDSATTDGHAARRQMGRGHSNNHTSSVHARTYVDTQHTIDTYTCESMQRCTRSKNPYHAFPSLYHRPSLYWFQCVFHPRWSLLYIMWVFSHSIHDHGVHQHRGADLHVGKQKYFKANVNSYNTSARWWGGGNAQESVDRSPPTPNGHLIAGQSAHACLLFYKHGGTRERRRLMAGGHRRCLREGRLGEALQLLQLYSPRNTAENLWEVTGHGRSHTCMGAGCPFIGIS